jgi:hypothetical protein
MVERKLIYLTKEQAIACLNITDDKVHNFVFTGPMSLGCDYTLVNAVTLINKTNNLCIAPKGSISRDLGHGLGVWTDRGWTFFETKEDILKKYEEADQNEAGAV